VYAGSDPATGKKRHLYGTAWNNRAAVKLENQLISGAERITPAKHSFNHLLDEWMKVARHAPTTQRNTRTQLDRHVRPVLGDLPIGEITTQRPDGFYADLEREGLSPATIRRRGARARSWLIPPARRSSANRYLDDPARERAPPRCRAALMESHAPSRQTTASATHKTARLGCELSA